VEIRINGEPIQYTIESERTVGEVVKSLESWLSTSGFCITNIQRDKADILKGCDTDPKPISQTELLDITAKPYLDVQYEHLSTLYQYMTLLKRAIEQDNRSLVTDCMRDFPSVYEALKSSLKEQEGDSFSQIEQLKRYVDEYNLTEDDYEKPGETFFTFLESLASIIAGRMNEILQPLNELSKTAYALKEIIPQMTDVSVLLQTGKDNEAMGTILLFIELSEKLIRLYRYITLKEGNFIATIESDGVQFGDFYIEFNKVLNEVIGALAAKDSVLTGDLFEYEVVPRIERLLSFLQVIKDRSEA